MKRGVFLFLVVVWATVVWGQIHLTTSDEITISGRTLDSGGFYITPESVRVVTYLDGAEVFDAWFNSGDGECAADNDMLVFTDAWGDIDGAGGDGLYELMAGFMHDDGDLYNWKTLWVYVGVDMADLATVAGDVVNIDAWDPHLDNDSLIIDISSLAAGVIKDILDTVRLIEGDVDDILDTLKNQDDWVAQQTGITAITDTANAILDTLQLWDDEMSLVTAMRDTIDATLDTLQNQDDWVSSFDVSSEFVIIQDTMETGDSVAVMPDFWSAEDSAGYQGAAAGLTKANIADTVWSHAGRTVIIEDTLTTGDSVGVMPDFWSAADSTAFQGDVSAVGDIEDTVNAILDTLQLQDDWIAQQTEVANFDGWDPHLDNDSLIIDMSELSARPAIGDTIQRAAAVPGNAMTLTTGERGSIEDSVYAQRAGYKADVSGLALATATTEILDSIKVYDDPGRFQADIQACLDSLNLQDNWVAKQIEIDSLGWRLGVKIGSKSYLNSAAGADTVWVCHGSDTLSFMIFYHPGGVTGDPPDTTEVEAP